MLVSCIHQGFELYGSDRAFIEAVSALRTGFPHATIEIVLPRGGPLKDEFERLGHRVTVDTLWVLRRSQILRLLTVGLASLPGRLLAARRRIEAADLTYVNTAVCLDHILAARLSRHPVLVHVHELPTGPTLIALRTALRLGGAVLIANSGATAAAFGLPMSVVPNGAVDTDVEPTSYDGERPLRVLMLGRLHAQKGQSVLVEAIGAMPAAIRARVLVRIAGGSFASGTAEQALRTSVAEAGLADTITIEPFADDPVPLYRWADVVVVPSRWGESLGRVAIEAMAYGRVPVVSATGGLVEVVEDARSGYLVPPDRADLLASRLAQMITQPASWSAMPAAAQARYRDKFSAARTGPALCAVADRAMRRHAPVAA